MSLKRKTIICLLVYFCAAGLTEAFNSERKSFGEVFIQPHNGQHKETKGAPIVPATPEETTQKINTHIRRARQTHERNRREKENEDLIIPNGNQVKNDYPCQFPTYTPASNPRSNVNPVVPGRQPSVTQPTALHTSGENANNQADQKDQPQRPQQSVPQGPARPLPIPQNPPVSRPSPQRPPLRPFVEEPPQKLDGPGSEPNQGDSCVWAIVKCCNQVPRPVSVPRCFELFGCPGAYFDNPCESDVAKSIARAANEIQQNALLFS